MNFNILKMGFQAYLQEKLANENKELAVANSDISIFMYADEFKEYITDELNLDSSICNASISDILDMEIDEHGKLVDPNAKEEETNNSTETENTETTVQEQNPVAQEGQDGQPMQGVATDGQMTQEGTQAIADAANISLEDPEILTGIMNDLLKDKQFIEAVDTDGDGEVNDEEIDAFFNTIKGNDKNENNISLDDILTATKQIKDNEFKITTPETVEESVAAEQPITQAAQQRFGGGGGGDFGNNLVQNNNTQKTPANTLDNKSLDELQAMLPDAENKVETAQTDLDTAMEAVNNNEFKDAVDEALKNYTDYLEQIQEGDDDFAKQIQDKNTQIDESKAKVDEIDKQLVDCLAEESALKSTISDADSSISALTETKNSLSSAIASAEGDEKSELQTKLSNIEAKIKEQQEKKDAAQEKLDTLQQETLPKLEEDKKAEEENLTKLETELNDLMTAAEEAYPDLAEYRAKYDEAKKTYEEEKVKAEEAVDTALNNLAVAQNELNELNTAISKAETKATIQENSPSGMTKLTQTAVELAYSQLGVHEDAGDNRGTMEKYGGRAGDPWCASFVSWLYGAGQSGNKSPLKYTAGVSNLRDQAISAGYYSEVGTYTPVPGDIMIQKSNGASHTGIVVGYDGEYVYTIEGNTSDAVRERKYKVGGSEYQKISGWIRMNEWSGGSNNVDGTTYLANADSEDADEKKRSTY